MIRTILDLIHHCALKIQVVVTQLCHSICCQTFMARNYGAAAIFGCYLASIRYVRLSIYLPVFVHRWHPTCSRRNRADVYVFSKWTPFFVDDLFIDINNVGSMSQCLYAYNNPYYDDAVGSGWQAAQVSTISIMNFSGRIFIGKFCSNSFYACTQSAQA